MPKTKWFVFPTKKKAVVGHTATALVHGEGSNSVALDYIVIDNKTISNAIIRFTETQINPPDSNCKIKEDILNLRKYGFGDIV